MMTIKISGLSEGDHYFEFNEPIKSIGLADPFINNFTAKIKLSKGHNQLLVHTDLTVKAKYDCDRCGKNFEEELSNEYRLTYLFGKEPVETEDENIIYLPLEADKINLDQETRDYALLAVPMKKLCMEDCKGLCPKCGKDWNEGPCDCTDDSIDDRWKPLLDLKKKLK